jgi:hypothetical protein
MARLVLLQVVWIGFPTAIRADEISRPVLQFGLAFRAIVEFRLQVHDEQPHPLPKLPAVQARLWPFTSLQSKDQ